MNWKIIGSVIGLLLSIFLGIVAFDVLYTPSDILGVNLQIVFVSIIIILFIYILIRSIFSEVFRKNLFDILLNFNYFSTVALFLTIIAASIYSVILIENSGLLIMFVFFAIPLFIFALAIAIAIILKKTEVKFDWYIALGVIIFIVIIFVATIAAIFFTLSKYAYYESNYLANLNENMPNCSEKFLKYLDDALYVGNYTFCNDVFVNFNYITTVETSESTSVVNGCKLRDEIFGVEECYAKMRSANNVINNTVLYCELQTSCYDKLNCYSVLEKISIEELLANKTPNGSVCYD